MKAPIIEGKTYTNGVKCRLVALIARQSQTVIYQEVDEKGRPTDQRRETTIADFNGWRMKHPLPTK